MTKLADLFTKTMAAPKREVLLDNFYILRAELKYVVFIL